MDQTNPQSENGLFRTALELSKARLSVLVVWTTATGAIAARGENYLHVMSRALRAFGQDSITDDSGKVHDWRREMAERLLALQEPDGSWINRKSDRWLEGESCLATAYAVLALEEVMASGVTASPSEMVPEPKAPSEESD